MHMLVLRWSLPGTTRHSPPTAFPTCVHPHSLRAFTRVPGRAWALCDVRCAYERGQRSPNTCTSGPPSQPPLPGERPFCFDAFYSILGDLAPQLLF